MDMKKAIINIFETKEIPYTDDFILEICRLVENGKLHDLRKLISDELISDELISDEIISEKLISDELISEKLYLDIIKLTNKTKEDEFFEQIVLLNSDTIMQWKIPKNLFMEKIEQEIIKKNPDLEILNFLNNEADLVLQEEEDSVELKMDLIFKLLEEKRIVLVQGDTGCGKTTKIPRYLLEKYNKIVCTQPRRIAAISVAKRVAQEMNTKIGDLVGYAVRFEDCTSKNTKLKYVTDGILLREIIQKGNLDKYDCLIIDEAHERTMNIDILLGFCKKILKSNSNTRIVLMSATLATEKFIDFFNCPFVDIKHKVFPLQNYFLRQYEPENWLFETVKTVVQIHNQEPKGDILVFLTGQEDIKEAMALLSINLNPGTCKILTIYSAMSITDQEMVFDKMEKRKIILSTNICETSVTIENIVYVVDSGRVKHMRHSNNLGMDILETVMISKAQAKQRSGRAGRTGPGKSFRIYTKNEFENMADSTLPEILTTNVCSGILTLKSLGISDLSKFEMIDMPKVESINDALEYLFLVRAVNKDGNITKLGREMANIPLDPNLSLTLIKSKDLGCFEDVAIISAMLTVDQIHIDVKKDDKILYKKFTDSKKSWYDERGDFFMLYKIFKKWQAAKFSQDFLKINFLSSKNMWQVKKIKDQLCSMFKIKNSSDISRVIEAFAFGYFMNIAKIKDDGYFTIFKETECFIHSSSCLYKKRENLILYFSIVRTKKEFLKYCNVITPEILCKSVNHVFNKK